MNYARTRDKNHAEIKAAFIADGWAWLDTFRFPGMFDALICKQGRNKSKRFCIIRVEVKQLTGRITPAEQEALNAWPGPVIIAYTPTDSLWLANELWERY